MKIVCIGNSIVNGFPYKRSCSFPSVLRELTGWEVINKGINGQMASELLERFDRDVTAHRPDKVVILTGTNDFILDQHTSQEVMEKIAAMQEKAEDFGAETIWMTPILCNEEQASRCWMPEAGVDYSIVNEKLALLGELMKAGARDKISCKVIDLAVKYRKFGKFHDGIHPTAEGQRYIANIVKEGI